MPSRGVNQCLNSSCKKDRRIRDSNLPTNEQKNPLQIRPTTSWACAFCFHLATHVTSSREWFFTLFIIYAHTCRCQRSKFQKELFPRESSRCLLGKQTVRDLGFQVKWNEMLVFDMRKKLEYNERKPLGTKKRNKKLNSQNLWHRAPTRTQATLVKIKRFHYYANPTHLNKGW